MADLVDDALAEGGVTRPEVQLPAYAVGSDVLQFAFVHTHLLHDCDATDVARVASRLRDSSAVLDRIQFAKVRNDFDHDGDPLPTPEELVEFCRSCRVLFDGLIADGLYPTVYRLDRRTVDRYGRERLTLADVFVVARWRSCVHSARRVPVADRTDWAPCRVAWGKNPCVGSSTEVCIRGRQPVQGAMEPISGTQVRTDWRRRAPATGVELARRSTDDASSATGAVRGVIAVSACRRTVRGVSR